MIPERISDEKIEEILRLASEEELTQGEIAEQVGVSRATAGKYIRQVKKKLKARNPGRIVVRDLNELCEAITPLILEKLGNQNPDKKNNEKKEEGNPMSEEDLAAKIQMESQRQRKEEKMGNDIASLKDDMKVIKDQGMKIPEELTQKLGKLEKQIEANTVLVKSFCEQFPELCATQERIETKLKEKETHKPGTVLGTDLSLGELLKSEKSQENLANKYMSDSGLLYALKRCTGDECRILRERAREQGINIQMKGKGAMPGSSGWKDID